MTDEQILNRRKKELTDKVIKDGGFYGRNGVWNSIITFPGDKHIYRHRVETIIVRNGKEVFLKKKPDGSYFLPGGSTEKDVSNIQQAVNECREEARINVKNIHPTGITYKRMNVHPSWAKNEVAVEWDAVYTEVYVAEYDSMYKGDIPKVDRDNFILSGQFYQTKDCFKMFRKEHRDALLWFLKTLEENEELTTESYISNYFKNKKLLRKISKSPDVDKGAIDQVIDVLKKEYGKLSAKSKIQRERKRKDVSEIFHPVLTFDFSDGTTITIAICFDEHEITDGMAISTDNYGEIVVVYPKFFNSSKEDQIFTILHEIGHIRLHHLDAWNLRRNIHGENMSDYDRQKKMSKGKCVYPEINADLYAILNGASMYAILNSSIKQDQDEMYDYRFTNAELANRYSNVFKKYNKLNKFNESDNSFSQYDIACLAIYEMTYENPSLSNLSEKDKSKLYSIMYESCIHKQIIDNEEVKEADSNYRTIRLTENKEDIEESYLNKIRVHSEIFNEMNEENLSVKHPIKGVHSKVISLFNEKAEYQKVFLEKVTELYESMKINKIITESVSPVNNTIINLLEKIIAPKQK